MDTTNSSTEKDLTIFDRSKPASNQASTPKITNSHSADPNSKQVQLNPLANHGNLTTTNEQAATKAAYQKLDAAILTCSPVVGHASTIDFESTSSTNIPGDVIALGRDYEPVISNSTSHVTPTTNRIVRSEKRHLDRSLGISERSTIRSKTSHSLNRHRFSSSPTMRPNGTIHKNSQVAQAKCSWTSISSPTTTQGARQSSCSSINLATLEQVPEYQKLKRELNLERQRCITWSEDYAKLRDEYEQYRAASFPRPTVDGLNFFLQLVDNLTLSANSIDTRSRSELAASFGLTEDQLNDCHHVNPQRAALMVFSKLYPTYRERAELCSIKKFRREHARLFGDIYIFARQCNPSALYTTEKMRDAIGASIRQAIHQIKKCNLIDPQLFEEQNDDENEDENYSEKTYNDLVMDLDDNNTMQ